MLDNGRTRVKYRTIVADPPWDKLGRHGRWHANWPDVFLLWRNRRVG
jgi:hypothetical protein